MEFKGTKGKWGYAKLSTKETDSVFIEADGAGIGTVWHRAEQEANAKLITAAPEMFEMLKLFLNEFEYDNATEFECNLFFDARKLLTKITN